MNKAVGTKSTKFQLSSVLTALLRNVLKCKNCQFVIEMAFRNYFKIVLLCKLNKVHHKIY